MLRAGTCFRSQDRDFIYKTRVPSLRRIILRLFQPVAFLPSLPWHPKLLGSTRGVPVVICRGKDGRFETTKRSKSIQLDTFTEHYLRVSERRSCCLRVVRHTLIRAADPSWHGFRGAVSARGSLALLSNLELGASLTSRFDHV